MSIADLALITNTHSKNKELWECHVKQIQKYMDQAHYFFSDEEPDQDLGVKTVLYNPKDKFRTQFLNCLREVKEPYVLYLNEDYLLYDSPDLSKLEEYVETLKNIESLSFIRLAKGVDHFNIPFSETLWFLDCRNPYFFSQTASLWKTEHLLKVHEHGPDLHIAGHNMSEQFEVAAADVCRMLGVQGLYHHSGEPKRGMHHYDSDVFPYIGSALVKGDWCSEYKEELTALLNYYNLDESTRSWS